MDLDMHPSPLLVLYEEKKNEKKIYTHIRHPYVLINHVISNEMVCWSH